MAEGAKNEQLAARLEKMVGDYAESKEFKCIGKEGNLLYLLDVSGCPFSCGNIHYMTVPYDGFDRFLLKDELSIVPSDIMEKFRREFLKRYGFEWRLDLTDTEIAKRLQNNFQKAV